MARTQGGNAYHRQLVAEFNSFLPPRLFRGLPHRGNQRWTPRTVVCLSVIMFWGAGKTLEERFSTARRIVKFIWPHDKIPTSSAGFVESQQAVWAADRAALLRQLRPAAALGAAASRTDAPQP